MTDIIQHWRRKWQPTSVFLPEESHGQRSLASHSHGVTRVRHDLETKQAPPPVYSTVNYTEYLAITYNGKESKKQSMCFVYICRTESLCCTLETQPL